MPINLPISEEMLPEIMRGVCTANRGHLLHYLEKKQAPLYNCCKVVGLSKHAVKVQQKTKNVPDPYNTWAPLLPENVVNPLAKKAGEEYVEKEIPADLVVLAMGGRADESQFPKAQQIRAAAELYNIGDSFKGGKVHEANKAAYQLAVSI